jgi:hypothetical protein
MPPRSWSMRYVSWQRGKAWILGPRWRTSQRYFGRCSSQSSRLERPDGDKAAIGAKPSERKIGQKPSVSGSVASAVPRSHPRRGAAIAEETTRVWEFPRPTPLDLQALGTRVLARAGVQAQARHLCGCSAREASRGPTRIRAPHLGLQAQRCNRDRKPSRGKRAVVSRSPRDARRLRTHRPTPRHQHRPAHRRSSRRRPSRRPGVRGDDPCWKGTSPIPACRARSRHSCRRTLAASSSRFRRRYSRRRWRRSGASRDSCLRGGSSWSKMAASITRRCDFTRLATRGAPRRAGVAADRRGSQVQGPARPRDLRHHIASRGLPAGNRSVIPSEQDVGRVPIRVRAYPRTGGSFIKGVLRDHLELDARAPRLSTRVLRRAAC